jgi:2-C-methyl-D-erythritol 2,4-cyclodiphosphate synthase
MSSNIRVGIGYDVHAFAEGRKLVLGGVEIPYARGLQGWSDADVLTHAVMDALLGAAGLGDIGEYFPPGDPQYQGISSLVLLAKVKAVLTAGKWKISNVDVMVLAEEPKLKAYKTQITRNLAEALGVSPEDIGIKAGTGEKLGFVGRGEGIAVQAVALIESTRIHYKQL